MSNLLFLEPHDVLFFRDGRPMGGASAGHGAAWPMPHVLNFAIHAALHRAGWDREQLHSHRIGRSGIYEEERERLFGSLLTAGPFPVESHADGSRWYFPRPADATSKGKVVLAPSAELNASSLPRPCRRGVASLVPPAKQKPKSWWDTATWNAYLQGTGEPGQQIDDDAFSDTEHTYGIGIDPATGTVAESQFYSAQYLRLQPGWRLGLFAGAEDKKFEKSGGDLVRELFTRQGNRSTIVVGGQQRTCSAELEQPPILPLPLGLQSGFPEHTGKWLVKWILLSPAIFPAMTAGTSKRGTERVAHPGGWLPNWIDPEDGRFLLRVVSREARADRRKRHARGEGYRSDENSAAIEARLVAAIVGKALPVTGYALPNPRDRERPEGGAKSTHLAVPTGSIYYFEADSPEEATRLAAALNWHGNGRGEAINRRRSTLYGEKGFGIGLCGGWQPFPS